MRYFLLLIVALGAFRGASAEVVLPEIIGSGMVLQQNSQAKLWGWADAHQEIIVEPSWGGKYAVRASAEGDWQLTIATPKGGYEPQQIIIAGRAKGDRIVLENVLIGEVWLAGGQSNMEMPLGGFWHCPVPDANKIIAQAGSKRLKLRYVKIPKSPAYEPQSRVKGHWVECSAETAPDFSAVAYFFSQMLNDVLDVPIGIIDCSWGGSRLESWCNRELLEGFGDVDLSREGIDKYDDYMRHLVMYNGMLHPISGYSLRGFIWYQGCSNVGFHDVYAQRMASMVELWRSRWADDQLPFYFVELAPYRHFGAPDLGAYLREAQFVAQSLIPNSGMVSTNDLVEGYEAGNIHPKHKQPIGERLAFWALNRTYKIPNVACQGPQFHAVEYRGAEAYLTFNNADMGFNRLEQINGFEICGPDSIFVAANARVGAGQRVVIVGSEQVSQPIAVRYGFRNNLVGNLANIRELPLVPFRTDDFPIARP